MTRYDIVFPCFQRNMILLVSQGQRFSSKHLLNSLKHEFPKVTSSPFEPFVVNIVCVKIFVDNGELFYCVVYFVPAQAVVASVRFIRSLYTDLLRHVVDRVTERVVESELVKCFPVKEVSLNYSASNLFSEKTGIFPQGSIALAHIGFVYFSHVLPNVLNLCLFDFVQQ